MSQFRKASEERLAILEQNMLQELSSELPSKLYIDDLKASIHQLQHELGIEPNNGMVFDHIDSVSHND